MPTTQEGGTPLSRLVDCYKAVSEGAVVKVLISNGDKNTDERQIVSEVVKAASPMLTSEALPVIGVAVSPNASHRAPALPTCAFGSPANLISAGAHRRDAVGRCQWLVRRHLLTASRRQP